jgi:DNA-binding response OmpR family regulator
VSPSSTTSPAGQPLLLVVEDDDTLASILERQLRAHGFDVVVCASAEDAIVALRLGVRPRLVVLDLNLRDATGWVLPRSPELVMAGSPPVVIASGSRVSSRRLADEGIAGYLPKPFPLETFMNVVRRLVYADAGGGDAVSA